MGVGEKIPECDRPDFAVVHKRLKDHVNDKWTKLFVVDIQNDCGCSIERYDIDVYGEDIVVLSHNGVSTKINDGSLDLAILPSISDKDIMQLLEIAGKLSKTESFVDLTPSRILYNPKSPGDKVCAVFQEYIGIPYFFRDGSISDWYSAEFVPEDEVWFLPSEEFFGVISVNVAGFGAMCIPKNILKVKLR